MHKKTMIIISALGTLALFGLSQAGELPVWDFKGKDAQGWVSRAHQCELVRIEEGVFKGVIAGADPFLVSPAFDIQASAGDVVEFRAKSAFSGHGELFWIPYGAKGAQQKWSTSFEWINDGQWHNYRVQPFWQGELRIGSIRLDFVNGHTAKAPFEISSIRIVNESGPKHSGALEWHGQTLADWRAIDGAGVSMKGDLLDVRFGDKGKGALHSPLLSADTDFSGVFSVEMSVRKGESALVEWVCSSVSGKHGKSFKIKPDGRFHTYNLELYADKNWKGSVVLLRLSMLGVENNTVSVRSIALGDEPRGPADISILQARQVNAVNRAGRPSPLYIQLENCGGEDAKNLKLSVKSLPRGVAIDKGASWGNIAEIISGGTITHTFAMETATPVKGMAEFILKGDGADNLVVRLPLEVLPALKLTKTDYVPRPKPLKSDYEIGALYFPGWSQISAWERIWAIAPERKPVLGWYDEANPEVVDWQIKWTVENGISYFLLDWYWHKGHQHHDHWVKAFQQCRYKSYLKFALMWANHNAAGSHSVEDQRNVVQFWIDNYFNMPEYYRIDDKPVVMIWSPENMERDVGAPGGCRKLLDLARAQARVAGYKGIYFIAMKWPEASTEPGVVRSLKDMGFDMTSIYHYMDHGGKAKDPRRFSFDLVADANVPFWRDRHATGVLPFLPNLSTGWDDRPWHGDKGIEIYGRTVDHFRGICREAKQFADQTGVKRMVLAPVNEWGEGSYAEPCAEFGFGMYEAVRDTFCQKPADGWPQNYAPADVGLGPYDLPLPRPDTQTDWRFKGGMQGWRVLMGIADASTNESGLTFKCTTRDPAINRKINNIRARDFNRVVVRMRSPKDIGANCQLFWSGGETPTEATSLNLPLLTDGEFHDYVFEVGRHRTWRGRIGYLRFDPCTVSDARMTVESIRLVPVE